MAAKSSEKVYRVNSTPVKKAEPPKKPDFEKSLARLEEVVRRLESPQLALDEAMKIPTGSTGRLSPTWIQLRGKQGEFVATDGRQLLIQGGFQFPWKEPVLVS